MGTIIYIAIFLTGVVFGSFFTLAVYRIPRKENIIYGRSHCTSCNHKLSFLDLIPILSYIFLGGKCRYCGEKIRIRYLLLEIFSGVVFLLVALTHGLSDIVSLCIIYLFIAGMFIIAGIDKENLTISNSLCVYEFSIALINLIYIGLTQSFKIDIFMDRIIGLVFLPFILYIIDMLVSFAKKDFPIGLR